MEISPATAKQFVKYISASNNIEIAFEDAGEVAGIVTITFELEAEIPDSDTR